MLSVNLIMIPPAARCGCESDRRGCACRRAGARLQGGAPGRVRGWAVACERVLGRGGHAVGGRGSPAGGGGAQRRVGAEADGRRRTRRRGAAPAPRSRSADLIQF